MTYTVRTYVQLGATVTEYTIHPPGFSSNPVDVGTEVVNKAVTSAAMSTGQTARVTSLTSAGELWEVNASAISGNTRTGIVQADSASGVPTVTISRNQRTPISCSTVYKAIGTDYNPGECFGRYITPNIPKIKAVLKPSAETWNANSNIYFYSLAGVTTYTSSLATASSSQKYGFAGICSIKRSSGDIDGFVDARYAGSAYGLGSFYYIASDNLPRVQSSTAFPLLSPIYSDEASTSFGTFDASLRPVLKGRVIVQIDATTSPTTYYYYSGPSNDCDSLAVTDLLYSDNAQVAHQKTTDFNKILSRYASTTSRIDVMASDLIGITNNGGSITTEIVTPGDLALDVDLPPPIGDIRIVWSPMSSIPGRLTPSIVRRTSTTAPETGMVASLSSRPPQFSGTSPIAGVNGIRQFSLPWRRLPYQVNEISVTPNAGAAARSYVLPDSIVVTSTLAPTWGWSRFDRGANAWVVLSSGNAMTNTVGSTWIAGPLGNPPGFANTDMAQFRIDVTSPSGATLKNQVYSGDMSLRLEVWPYDVPKFAPAGLPVFSDCRWVGSKGWYCNDTFTMPTVTWGTASASYGGGILNIDLGLIPTFTTSAAVGTIEASTDLWKYPRYQLISGDYVSVYSLASNSNSWANKKNGTAISRASTLNSVTIINPRGSAGPSIVQVNCWQVHIVESDYGRMKFVREINGLSVTMP